MKKLGIILALLVSAFLSCTRQVEVNLPPHIPRLVVHGYVAVGDTFSVSVGTTVSQIIPGINTFYIGNASVLLYEEGIFKDTLRFNVQQRRYSSGLVTAISGRTYKIIASATGFTSVEASATAPFPTSTVSISHIVNARFTSDGSLLDDVKFAVNDPVVKNFYLVKLMSLATVGGGFCIYTYDPSVEKYKQDLTLFDADNCIVSDQILYTDKLFNGLVKEITLSVSPIYLTSFTTMGTTYKPYLKRYTISEDYYRYFKNTLNLDVETNFLSFSEPANVEGNVKNGHGLFTVFAVATDTIP